MKTSLTILGRIAKHKLVKGISVVGDLSDKLDTALLKIEQEAEMEKEDIQRATREKIWESMGPIRSDAEHQALMDELEKEL